MKLETVNQVREFRKDARGQTEQVRRAIARKLGIGASYYHGHHFQSRDGSVNRDWESWQSTLRGIGVRSGGDMQVAMNRINRYITKIASASFMRKFDPQVRPSPRSRSAEDSIISQVNEDVLFHMARSSGFVGATRNAVLRRSIAGQWLVGLGLNVRTREVSVNGKLDEIEEKIITAFDAPMHRLSIDTGNEHRDLLKHDWAVYSDVWTQRKLHRVLGLDIADDELAEIGTLTPIEQEYASLTKGALFNQYRQHSKTRGAFVHMIYVKGSDSRFDTCFIEVELAGVESIVWNMENPLNPFGSHGLPLIRLGGHKAAEGWVDQSDFDFMKDDQDILNLALTHEQRLMRKTAGAQWDVDRRWFSDAADDDEVREHFTNEAWGIRVGSPKKDAKPPILQQSGNPANWFGDVIARQESSVQEQSFRPGSYFGEQKSHVPAEVVARTMDAAGDVFGQRVIEDIEQYEVVSSVMLGTAIGLAQSGNVHTLQYLRNEAEFGDDEFEMLSSKKQSMERPKGIIIIRESAARYRSTQAIEQSMSLALQQGAMSPSEWRAVMARDLDMPIGESERVARIYAMDTVQAIMNGEPFTPITLRPAAHEILIAELEQAMLDSKLQPELQQALMQAIDMQNQLILQRQAEAQMATEPQKPEPTAADAMSPADMLGMALQGQV